MLGNNGGLIGASRTPQNGIASGLWTPQEQSVAAVNNVWPAQKYTARYWRWTNLSTNSSLVEVSEWRLSNNGTYISGGTWLTGGANFTFVTPANFNNNDLSTRAFQFQTPNAASTILYDYGSPVTADGWQYASQSNGANFATGATVQISHDGTTFFPIKTFTNLSQYTGANSVISPVYMLSPIRGGYTYRYFRFSTFANTALNSNSLDLSEIQFFSDFNLLTGITTTSNITWSVGQNSFLTDGIISEATSRSYNTSWSTIQSSSTISFDLGSPKTVTHLRIISCYTQPRFPASFNLEGSNDGSSYTTLATVTVGTPSVSFGTNLRASSLITL